MEPESARGCERLRAGCHDVSPRRVSVSTPFVRRRPPATACNICPTGSVRLGKRTSTDHVDENERERRRAN